ncbi:MAG TPA: hypothetical protein VG929_12025 [Actinomycetota bacterium]|nr:hypothetical protein [Actinomycetota bacterium]
MGATEQKAAVPMMYLVECYWPGVTRTAADAALGRVRAAAAEISLTQSRVRVIRATFLPADEALLTLFEAFCADAVLDATEQGGLTADRISVVENLRAQTRGSTPTPSLDDSLPPTNP